MSVTQILDTKQHQLLQIKLFQKNYNNHKLNSRLRTMKF